MKVLALVPHPPAGASTRYRVLQFLPGLERRGWSIDVAPMLDVPAFDRLYRPGAWAAKAWDFARAGARRLVQVIGAARADVVLVHREVWPLAGLVHENLLRGRNPRFVFDLDDAVYLPNVSRANQSVGFLKAAHKSEWLARHAAAVSAGNRFLAAWAQGAGANARDVFTVPTAVDTDAWRVDRVPDAPGPPILGWIGSHSTVGSLAPLRPAFVELARRVPGLRLRVIGASFTCPGIEVESVPWSFAGEVEALAGVTLGLAPLADDEWARGKCGLKVLQYMALGKPVVSSPIGANRDIVVGGVTGLFADGAEAWRDAVLGLLESPADRGRMGAAGRERVEREYSLREVEPRLAQALMHAAETSS
jgi:glycosyltransferase involved in cell wall biosynthesis